MLDKIALFGKSEGYVVVFCSLAVTATALLWFGKLDQPNYVSLVQWAWASVCGGGAVSAFRPK